MQQNWSRRSISNLSERLKRQSSRTADRRYNFPNRNATRNAASYSAQVDADDLAMLIEHLHLGPVNLVGHSYGGLGAILFATEHPMLVRTLTLSEPPVLPWVEEQSGGAASVRDFFQRCWNLLGRALAQHKRREALVIALKYFTGSSVVPPAARAALEPNLQEWEVLTASRNVFPLPAAKAIEGLHVPVLLLTGDHTLPLLKRCVAALTARFAALHCASFCASRWLVDQGEPALLKDRGHPLYTTLRRLVLKTAPLAKPSARLDRVSPHQISCIRDHHARAARV